ncbi:receptor-like protein 43 [Juglans regia]|uniref:Receptor-like protein 43 n=1 Tax=Juglans regia TaxID=51240 RepID=A0A2I4G4T6_JUGRE|nr:receptor-like protein 43 [Juglans regia]
MHNVSKESLQYFYLSNNFLTGIENSPAIILWPNLKDFSLDNNMMHGLLPIPPPSLEAYFVNNNSFTGRISPFICNMSSPVVLDLSHNYLSGLIHPCMGNLSQSLKALVLRSNNFGNTIPKTWAKGCSLKMIDLSQNQLQGHLPRSLANCTELEYLRVSGNQINDTDPFWLGTLQHLKILDLHSNGFHGAIRSLETNYTFSNLCIIDLSHNHLSGNLSERYFTQWDAMKSVGANNLQYMGDWVYYSIIITIKGVELEYKKIQDGLTVIDFSCNRFEGDIPEILGNLEGLRVLNLSNNAFTGHIPSSFANLTQLESLDLSRNKLFGKIPLELVQLNFLSKFNVSHNCLTGPIPQGQQFGTFPNTSFEGNRGLCGWPLSKLCGDSDISTPPPSTFEENQGPKLFFEFGWKVVVMGYGCGFVFGVVIGHIVTTRKQDWLIRIFGKKKHQTRISRVNRRVNRRK